MFANLLTALFDIALDHNALYQSCQFAIGAAGMHDFMHDTDLFFKLLVGVAVVRVHDTCTVHKVALVILDLKSVV